MRFVKPVLSIVMLLIIAAFGYWLYGILAGGPDAPYWAGINRNMPGALHRYACVQVRKGRTGAAVAGCEDV
jgi:hypothetical protein